MIKSLFEEFDNNPANELILSSYGLYPAFVFRGTEQFVERITNLVINYSMLGHGKIKKLCGDYNGKFILAPEDRLLAGIKQCFRAEVICNRGEEINYKFEVKDAIKDEENSSFSLTYDEKKLDSLALNMTAKFWTENVKKINLFIADSSTEFNYDGVGFGRIQEGDRLTEL